MTLGTGGGGIEGDKWNDLNGNGVRDAGEPTLPGWRIYLDANGNGQLDPGEQYQDTDVNGHYAFVVAPGTYTVREVLQSGWIQTFPGAGGPVGLLGIAWNGMLYDVNEATGAASNPRTQAFSTRSGSLPRPPEGFTR